MSKITDVLNEFTMECDWKDAGLLGLGLGSLGVLAGMVVLEKYKNATAFATGGAFFLSVIALTVRSIRDSKDDFDEYEDFEEWERWDEEDEPGFVMRITTEEE